MAKAHGLLPNMFATCTWRCEESEVDVLGGLASDRRHSHGEAKSSTWLSEWAKIKMLPKLTTPLLATLSKPLSSEHRIHVPPT